MLSAVCRKPRSTAGRFGTVPLRLAVICLELIEGVIRVLFFHYKVRSPTQLPSGSLKPLRYFDKIFIKNRDKPRFLTGAYTLKFFTKIFVRSQTAYPLDCNVKIKSLGSQFKPSNTSKSWQRQLKNPQRNKSLKPQLPPSRLLRLPSLPSSSWLSASSTAGTSISKA